MSVFLPKDDFDRWFEAQYPNASPAEIAELIGYDPQPLPFRCPRCKTRPVLARAPVPELYNRFLCRCFGAVYGPDSSLPHNAKGWAALLDQFDALKAMHRHSLAQIEANN
jgi:hypothetical protein